MQIETCSFRPLTRTSVSLHRHPHVEWHYVLDGQCGFVVDGDRHPIRTGDLFVVTPGQVHGVHVAHPGEWLIQYIVTTNLDAELMAAWRPPDDPLGVRAIGTSRHALFARIQRDLDAGDPWLRRAASHRFQALLCTVLGAAERDDNRHPAVDRALDLMRSRLRSRLTLRELAEHVALDRHYLSRLFSRQIGSAPMACYTDMKMQLAAGLLRADQTPIATIAQAIGYDDPFHFSRVFRRWAGSAPSQWRQHSP